MNMDLARELHDVEAICDAIETAIEQEDWQAATACNANLLSRLRRFGDRLQQQASSIPAAELTPVYQRLDSVQRHHRKLTLSLRQLRDGAAAELDSARAGRRASRHYMETAGH